MSFRAKHLIFPVRKACKLTMESIFPVRLDPKMQYELQIVPFSGLRKYGLRNTNYVPTPGDEVFFSTRHPLTQFNDSLEITVTLPQEDCYVCRVFAAETQICVFEIYALEEDLLVKTPYKGDQHMHSCFSDGHDSPMYMAAAACSRGYDYCVITDHGQYQPSLLARDFYTPTGVDFLVIPGEEVHSPDNPVHIINLGGEKSVNDWWREQEPEYRAAVEKEMETITEPMTDRDRYAAAASQVMFDKIREAKGVAVLCHPHWILGNGFNEHEDITEYLADHRRYDALELIAGGAYEVGTQMQLSYYKPLPNMPILGNSDAHGCFCSALEPGNSTIVFADSLSCEGIKDAIRAGFTVACDENRFYGDYRLVKYAYFLQRNYLPGHKQKRMQLSNWMIRRAAGNTTDPLPAALRPSEDFALLRYQGET